MPRIGRGGADTRSLTRFLTLTHALTHSRTRSLAHSLTLAQVGIAAKRLRERGGDRKWALFLDAPPGELDFAGSFFSDAGNPSSNTCLMGLLIAKVYILARR